MKTDAKIDMLHQSGMFGKSPTNSRTRKSDVSDDPSMMSVVSGYCISSYLSERCAL
jgi:hypothetical protein